MASFLRGVRDSKTSRSRDTIIKESLTNNLSECVKAIQFNHQTEECLHQIVGSSDTSNALCFALEAIFLHGQKDTFFKKAKNAFSGDIDNKPEPSFWPLILVLSHRDHIEDISSLRQISTEIGQCRAWVRMALNDCLMSSYISTILRNINSTKSFYSTSAFIRDSELLDVAQRFLEGVESCTEFDLPINSSLLNTWPEDVLMMAGVWMPTMKTCPVAPGVDIASTLSDDGPREKRTAVADVSILGRMLAMDQDEALNFILSSTPDDAFCGMSSAEKLNPASGSDVTADLQAVDDFDPTKSDQEASGNSTANEMRDASDGEGNFSDIGESSVRPDSSAIGNSLIGKTGWSSDASEDARVSVASDSSNASKTPDSKSLTSLVDAGITFVKTPNLRELMKGLRKELKLTGDDDENVPPASWDTAQVALDDPVLTGLGYEVVSKLPSTIFESPELEDMITRLGSLSREYGLDSQEYECVSCHDLLGTRISKAKVCSYTGKYFCSDCMDPNVFMIPAKVIHNWDFRRYPVSKRVALFLLEFQHHPLINIKKMNSLIYVGVEPMAQLQRLRIQLNFLRAYLFTCREHIIEKLQKRVWPREYLYEHVHLYSISDLAQISNGSLANQLQKVISFAQGHVKDCCLCSQKGFICEVCKDPKVLYPFDTDTTYRCDPCSSVFHATCLNRKMICPKCKRKKDRQGISLVDAVHTNFV